MPMIYENNDEWPTPKIIAWLDTDEGRDWLNRTFHQPYGGNLFAWVKKDLCLGWRDEDGALHPGGVDSDGNCRCKPVFKWTPKAVHVRPNPWLSGREWFPAVTDEMLERRCP